MLFCHLWNSFEKLTFFKKIFQKNIHYWTSDFFLIAHFTSNIDHICIKMHMLVLKAIHLKYIVNEYCIPF